jgi:hypothetical protein
MILFSIRDEKANIFHAMSQGLTEAEAIRGFTANVNNPQNDLLHTYPSDYALYRLGEFDQETGEITPEHPKKLISGDQVHEKV